MNDYATLNQWIFYQNKRSNNFPEKIQDVMSPVAWLLKCVVQMSPMTILGLTFDLHGTNLHDLNWKQAEALQLVKAAGLKLETFNYQSVIWAGKCPCQNFR